ncbi:shikimate dehydrogenase [Yunchengibacter salinarum]|uniref:shikimate dehydrogenase n=1 Tax=Yunchengibacter salinarum TaxID=3133399 RepID=UPI0035B63999
MADQSVFPSVDALPHDTRALVLGHPVGHSLSPLMQDAWLDRAGLNGRYAALDVAADDLADTIAALRKRAGDGALAGFNVTVPHKEAVLDHLDSLSPSARQMGAVNTVRIQDGRLAGFNTDGIGFMRHLDQTVPHWPVTRPPLVLGAGGAARAVVSSLIAREVPFVMLSNRTREKAEALAAALGRGRVTVVDWEDRSAALAGAGLCVNTTALGMAGQPPLALDLGPAPADMVVYDIVYKPLHTPLLQAAAARGLATVDGLGMLAGQGAAAFELWFGVRPVYDAALKARLMEALGERD